MLSSNVISANYANKCVGRSLFNESGMHIAFNCYLNLVNTGLLVIVVVLDRLNDPGSSALNNASH